jgi:hypothetical protein
VAIVSSVSAVSPATGAVISEAACSGADATVAGQPSAADSCSVRMR